MNARCSDGLVHLLVLEPRVHAINPDHVVQMGLTECGLYFTWLTGPRYQSNEAELRLTATLSAPTCLRCMWQAEHA